METRRAMSRIDVSIQAESTSFSVSFVSNVEIICFRARRTKQIGVECTTVRNNREPIVTTGSGQTMYMLYFRTRRVYTHLDRNDRDAINLTICFA